MPTNKFKKMKIKRQKGPKKTPAHEYDKKILRIWAILNKIATKGSVSTPDLAREFNVTPRSVQRDINILERAGFPITSLDKGKHSFMEGFSLKKMEITEEEASLLSFLYEIASHLGGAFEESFKGIFRKVISRDGESPFYVKITEGQKLDKEFPDLPEIKRAIEECRNVELNYQKDKATKWLRVSPLKIAYFDGFWYVVSKVSDRNWILKLRLDKISGLKVLDTRFKVPANLRTLLDESVNAWFSEDRDKKITLRIDGAIAAYFKRKSYFPLQKIKKEDKDGSLILESEVCQYMEAIPTIMRWVPHVTVIEPAELKKEVEEKVKEYLGKM